VPVLSSATVRIRPSASRAAPPLIKTPSLEAAPIAATTVTGIAIASAHGEAATSTTRARSTHTRGSPSALPTPAITPAAIITEGTNGRAILSANRWAWPLRDCSASTIRTILARELSRAAAVTVTSRTPVPLMKPAKTSLPGPASVGTDSPVIAEVSSAVCPELIVPSVARRSPGLTIMVSPTTRSVGDTTSSRPPRRTVAVSGTSESSARKPRRVLVTAYSSSPSLIANRKASMAASPTSPSTTAPTAAMVIKVPTPILPRASRRSVEGTKV